MSFIQSPPMVTSCCLTVAYHEQDVGIARIHPSFSHFTSCTCTHLICVYLVPRNSITSLGFIYPPPPWWSHVIVPLAQTALSCPFGTTPTSLLSSPIPKPWQPRMYSHSQKLAISRMLYKWNHRICNLLGLAFFTRHYSLEIHQRCGVDGFFLLLNNNLWYGCVTVQLFTP